MKAITDDFFFGWTEVFFRHFYSTFSAMFTFVELRISTTVRTFCSTFETTFLVLILLYRIDVFLKIFQYVFSLLNLSVYARSEMRLMYITESTFLRIVLYLYLFKFFFLGADIILYTYLSNCLWYLSFLQIYL